MNETWEEMLSDSESWRSWEIRSESEAFREEPINHSLTGPRFLALGFEFEFESEFEEVEVEGPRHSG